MDVLLSGLPRQIGGFLAPPRLTGLPLALGIVSEGLLFVEVREALRVREWLDERALLEIAEATAALRVDFERCDPTALAGERARSESREMGPFFFLRLERAGEGLRVRLSPLLLLHQHQQLFVDEGASRAALLEGDMADHGCASIKGFSLLLRVLLLTGSAAAWLSRAQRRLRRRLRRRWTRRVPTFQIRAFLLRRASSD